MRERLLFGKLPITSQMRVIFELNFQSKLKLRKSERTIIDGKLQFGFQFCNSLPNCPNLAQYLIFKYMEVASYYRRHNELKPKSVSIFSFGRKKWVGLIILRKIQTKLYLLCLGS